MKLINTVVDLKMRLVGFIAEGKEREFGGFTNETITKPVVLKALSDSNFKNNQLAISNGRIEQLGSFKLNSLPMLQVRDNGYVPINNEIILLKRFLHGNEPVGFEVSIAGNNVKYSYDSVVKLSFWFKPVNYLVRTSATGKQYVAGKPGIRLEDLPQEILGEDSKAKRVKSKTVKEEDTGFLSNLFDIVDIYEHLQSEGGMVLMLPTEKYVRTGSATTTVASSFIDMGIGEIGTPYIEVGEKKLNANTNFKKPGIVNVEHKGRAIPVQSYVYRKKTIFRNGENHIGKFGVVLPIDKETDFIDKFSKGMAITPIEDVNVIKPFMALVNRQDVKFFEIDASKLDMLSKKKIDESLLEPKDIKKLMEKLYVNKLIQKYLGTRSGVLKQLKEDGLEETEVKGRSVSPMFEVMDKQFIEAIERAGINIYDGSFTQTEVETKEDKEKSGKKSLAEDDTIIIEYAIAGLDAAKIKVSDIEKCGENIPKKLIKIVEKINELEDNKSKAKLANKLLKKSDAEVAEIKFELWKHKCAMYIDSDYTSVHGRDKESWELNTKKKTKAKFYNCTDTKAKGLMVGLEGIDIQ